MRSKSRLFLILSLILIGGAFYLYQTSDDALEVACEWAKLDKLPQSNTNLKIEVKGNEFTRQFVINFDAQPNEIIEWLNRSPGTKNLKPQIKADGSRLYKIDPAEGAQFAEVTISATGKHVMIRTYWS